MSEIQVLVCPVHGVVNDQHITTQKTCGLCMEEQLIDAGRAPRLRIEYIDDDNTGADADVVPESEN